MRHVDGCRRPLTLLLLLLTLLSAAVISAPPAGAAESERSGVLHIVHGDPPPGSSAAPITLYTLWEAGDRHTRLTIPNYVIASAGGEQALRQRAVTVRGTARDDARLDVSSITLQQAQPDDGPFMASANALAVSGSQRWYTILCKFSDVSDEPQSQSWFNSLISGSSTSYPGLDHYWREVSYNQSNIGGSTVNGWFNLPQPRSFYVTGSGSSQTADLSALATDCTNAAGGSSVLSGYMGVNYMFNHDLDCCAWGGSVGIGGVSYAATWMPVWGWSNQMILAHEMGHGYGLSHSSGPYNEVYDSHWDVMSRGGTCSAPHAQYGCVAVHAIAYHKDVLGWIAAATKTTVTPGATPATFSLAPLGAPAPSGSLHMIRIPIQGSSTRFYTVEARRFIGYDSQVPGQAVVLHNVNTSDGERPARVVDVDNDGDPNDAAAMWEPGETFIDATNDIAIEITSFNGTTYQVSVRCNACGNVIDAEVVSATGPANVTQGQTATISAQVRNNGTASATISVDVTKSPSGFSNSQSVTLNAGQSQTVQFTWPTTDQTTTGNHTFTVTAMLASDSVPGNNSRTHTVRVDVLATHDAEVVSLTGPAGVTQGQTATLSVEVRNNGNVTDTISVSIATNPAGFSESQSVTLNAGQSQTIQFSWPTTDQSPTGDHVFTATASVADDGDAGNNARTHTVRVDAPSAPPPDVVDVEVISLNGPDSVTQGQTATLTAQARNNGTSNATFDVSIASSPAGFSQSQSVTLGPGQSQAVVFTWPTTGQTGTGSHTFTATATLAGDTVSGNNAKSHTVQVVQQVTRDAEVVSTSGPASVTQGQTATISAVVRNNGTVSETVTVGLTKNPPGFSDNQQVTLAPGASQTVTFNWQTSEQTALGNHVVTVSASVAGDSNTGNDSKQATIRVDSPTAPPGDPAAIDVVVTVKCYQIDGEGRPLSDRCDGATLAGQTGASSDGYRYTFTDTPAPASAPLVLYPTPGGAACQAGSLALVSQPSGVQTFLQERSCTTWTTATRTIQQVAHFGPTWARADLAVATGQAIRTWLWGPVAYSGFLAEPYQEASGVATALGFRGLTAFEETAWSGGYRLVIYLDKSRMEITHPNAVDDGLWYVTNGLLVVELTTGNLQLGDNAFEQSAPAQVNVGGDGDDPTGPTYATVGLLRDLPALPDGALITQRVDRDGVVTNDPGLAGHGVTAAHRVQVPGIDHQVASVFWEYMQSAGVVFQDGAYGVAPLFDNPFYATGLPISEAYWARVKVAGTYKDVLIQCFERRCLTWTPDNPEGWKVEAGNVGQHYFAWRYGE